MKVIEKNHRGALTYSTNGVELRPGKPHTALIRFPAGTEKVHHIEWHTETLSYNDMGGLSGPIESEVPYIKLDYLGVEVGIKFTLVEVIL